MEDNVNKGVENSDTQNAQIGMCPVFWAILALVIRLYSEGQISLVECIKITKHGWDGIAMHCELESVTRTGAEDDGIHKCMKQAAWEMKGLLLTLQDRCAAEAELVWANPLSEIERAESNWSTKEGLEILRRVTNGKRSGRQTPGGE